MSIARDAVATAHAVTLAHAASVVKRGGVLVYPTETVYGIGGDPFDAAMVERVRAIKGRDAHKPMLAITDRWGRVADWITNVTDAHRTLMAATDDAGRPLAVTLLFEAGNGAPSALVSEVGLIGIRRTHDPLGQALVAACGTALLSTSANRAGEPPASVFADLDPHVVDAADYAFDAGRPLGGTPSTVVKVKDDALVVIREGAVRESTLRALVGG
ncbi:MAG: L-threonylcarbamoyladenylate synthase [Bacteroidota bacterium]